MKRTVVQLSDEHWRIIRSIVKVARQSGQNMVPCKCPAGHDAALLLNYLPPAVYCFKERCKPDVDAINAALRDAFADAVEEGTLLAVDPEVLAERKRLRKYQAEANYNVLPVLLDNGPIPMDAWLDASPFDLREMPVQNHWKLMLELFRPHVLGDNKIIWCGKLHETGSPFYGDHFRTIDEWLREEECLGPQICQGIFFSKHEGRIIQRVGKRGDGWPCWNPFLVLESDDLKPEQFAQIILYAVETLGLVLVAIVDTGGKSLHAWFIKPKAPESRRREEIERAWEEKYGSYDLEDALHWPEAVREARAAYYDKLRAAFKAEHAEVALFLKKQPRTQAILKGLSCDHKLWRSNATARMPGIIRLDDKKGGTGDPILDSNGQPRWQRLIYLSP